MPRLRDPLLRVFHSEPITYLIATAITESDRVANGSKYYCSKCKRRLSVPRPRLELGTNSLKGYCSTIELPGHT